MSKVLENFADLTAQFEVLPDRHYSFKEAARFTNEHPRTLRRKVDRGVGPKVRMLPGGSEVITGRELLLYIHGPEEAA